LALSGRVLRSVRALSAAAHRLGAGDLAQRVQVRGHDEIAELGRVFNQMAASLAESEARQCRLTSDIAHELRTPLANLRGYLEALSNGVLDPSPELLRSLHEETLLQQRLVDDLQDLATAEAGTLAYHWADIDVEDLLMTACTAHRQHADAHGVSLTARTHGPMLAVADSGRLRQAVDNLISNALRATSAGGQVSLEGRAEHGQVILEVADTGSGIASEDLPRVFDRLWRGDPARGRETGGSGLGLAIARQIIADHRGSIEARSVLNSGSTFTVRLPESRAE
jgi:two-component system sensor histidine kinase BaeS